jgi:hypothetical protein
MKALTSARLFLLLTVLWISGCSDRSRITYTDVDRLPIMLSFDDIRSGYKAEGVKEMVNPGRIYVYGQYLLINDLYDGIHIIDNADPSKPVKLGYLRIPGNTDAVVRNNQMYVNSGPDLLILDMSNVNAITLTKRVENAFFETAKKSDNMYLIGFGEKEVVRKEYTSRGWNFFFGMQEDVAVMSSENRGNTDGVGGSMARFTLAGDYLYVVNESSLLPIDISTSLDPKTKNAVPLNRGTIETIYKYKEFLFIGSTNGVFIVDYTTNPAIPVVVSTVQHIQACDPVVVQDDIAFSTLSVGQRCGGGVNELMVLNVKNAANPIILAEYFFDDTPLGLGINAEDLFICMGDGGIHWFKTNNLKDIQNNKVTSDVTLHAWDVIVLDGQLIVTGEEGIFQYEYDSENKTLNKVSTLFSRG